MFDYAFFAVLFLLAQALAPQNARTLVLENVRHPEQTMQWTRGADGWTMTINRRELGRFTRSAEGVTHQLASGAPQQWALAELVQPADLSRRATRVRLGTRFSGTLVVVTREGPQVRLTDPSREILRVPLRLRTR